MRWQFRRVSAFSVNFNLLCDVDIELFYEFGDVIGIGKYGIVREAVRKQSCTGQTTKTSTCGSAEKANSSNQDRYDPCLVQQERV